MPRLCGWEGTAARTIPAFFLSADTSRHLSSPRVTFLIVVSALKIKSQELFDEWVSKLRHHRLYRQNEIAMYPNEKSFYYPHYPSPNSPTLAKSAPMRKVYFSTTQRSVDEKLMWSVDAFLCLSAYGYGCFISNIYWSQSPSTEVWCEIKANCYWSDLWEGLPLQCMSIQRQSTVHAVGAFPLSCNSQAKVTAWLQSSDDMDKCSKGETTEPPLVMCGFPLVSRFLKIYLYIYIHFCYFTHCNLVTVKLPCLERYNLMAHCPSPTSSSLWRVGAGCVGWGTVRIH